MPRKPLYNENMALPRNDADNVYRYGDIKAWDILPINQEQVERYFYNRRIVLSLLHEE